MFNSLREIQLKMTPQAQFAEGGGQFKEKMSENNEVFRRPEKSHSAHCEGHVKLCTSAEGGSIAVSQKKNSRAHGWSPEQYLTVGC